MNPIFARLLERTWQFVRSNAFSTLLLATAAYGAYKFFQREQTSVADKIDQLSKLHDVQLKSVSDAYELERKAHEENLKKLQASLDDIQKKYDERLRELAEMKEKRVKKIIDEAGDDPVVMATKVTEVTGFQVYKTGAKK